MGLPNILNFVAFVSIFISVQQFDTSKMNRRI